MLKKTALFFSFVFHPLFMPVLGILILFHTGSYVSLLPLAARKMIILLFVTGTIILPALMIPLTILRKDFLMHSQNERNIPLTLTLIFYLLTYFLFLKVPVYQFMHNFMGGACLTVFMALFINFFWKISLHMIGLGGLTAFLIMITMTRQINLLPWMMISVFASGIVGTSRLYLNEHSPAQIYVGYFVGFASMTICMWNFNI
jgi:hypothetical protein